MDAGSSFFVSVIHLAAEVHVKEYGGETMLATFAFDVCHDVYQAAREVIDTKIPTLSLESSGKYLWHPDRMPRLAEYVADFARAGESALAGGRGTGVGKAGLREGPVRAGGAGGGCEMRQAEACPTGGAQCEPHGDVSRVLPGGSGLSGGAEAPGNQRTDLGGLGGRDSHERGARAGEIGSVSAVEIFSGDVGKSVVARVRRGKRTFQI